MEVIVNPLYSQYTDFANRIPEMFAKEGKTIYKARNEIKIFEVDGKILNVKQYKVPMCFNRITYSFFRQPKAVRAYEHALKLNAKDISTADPIAYILFRRKGLLHQSYFISLQSDYKTLYDIGREPVGDNEDLFTALGHYVAQLHEAEVYHEDFSPGNILYKRTDKGIKFCLIDINRMRFGPVSLKRGCENFARVWGKEAAFHLMAQSYAEGRRADADYCTDRILHYRNRFWKRYGRKHPIDFEL